MGWVWKEKYQFEQGKFPPKAFAKAVSPASKSDPLDTKRANDSKKATATAEEIKKNRQGFQGDFVAAYMRGPSLCASFSMLWARRKLDGGGAGKDYLENLIKGADNFILDKVAGAYAEDTRNVAIADEKIAKAAGLVAKEKWKWSGEKPLRHWLFGILARGDGGFHNGVFYIDRGLDDGEWHRYALQTTHEELEVFDPDAGCYRMQRSRDQKRGDLKEKIFHIVMEKAGLQRKPREQGNPKVDEIWLVRVGKR